MGYRALLFCPDEKTAQTVTLILNELEFSVEACGEPFAAVKKITAEHFDGIVVDCDNEQNAMLLFKSSRQSPINQAALAVAIVEGQAGVAKAFRIGANLVLTKPINVDQTKGTLRVARGLLRKSESAKPAIHAESVSATTAPTPAAKHPSANTVARPASPVPAIQRPVPTPAAMPSPWGNRLADSPAPVAHASAPHEDMAEVLETEVVSDATPHVGPIEDSPRAAGASSTIQSAIKQTVAKASGPLGSGSVGTGSASAAASARIPQKVNKQENHPDVKAVEPLLSKIARTVAKIEDKTAGQIEDKIEEPISASDNELVVTKTPKSFANIPLASNDNQTKTEPRIRAASELQLSRETQPENRSETQPAPENTSSRKTFLVAVAVVLLAIALYFGWAQLHGKITLGSFVGNPTSPSSSVKPQPPAPRNVPPAPASTQAVSSPSSVPSAEESMQETEQHNSDTDADANESASELRRTGKSKKASANTDAAKTDAQPLVVKRGKQTKLAERTPTDAAAPSVAVSENGAAGSLTNLVDVSSNSVPVLQTLAVSQGVSQGLIVKKVQPTYPAEALTMRIEGSVTLEATVGKSGNITGVKTLHGEPMLAQAATDAVKKWKYKPYLLNGQPVEIQTQITINFKLPQ